MKDLICGDVMFKIFTFKQLSFLAIAICLIMLFSASLNAISPYAQTFAKNTSVKVPIIMYHQISQNSALWGDYVIPLKVLENDFSYFKENGITPVSFKDLNNYVKFGKKLPKKCVVITFDDGERTFLTKVLPLMEKYKYPANVNIVGSLTELYTKNGDTNDKYAYLNEDDIVILSQNSLVELGCHSYELHSLTKRKGMGKLKSETEEQYSDIIWEDISLFQSQFSRLTGANCHIMAYPYGIRNEYLSDLLKNNGFSVTLTCRESVNTLSVGGDLYELGRFNRPYGISSENFFKNIFE